MQRTAVYQLLAHYYKQRKKHDAALQAATKATQLTAKLALHERAPVVFFLRACLHGLLGDPSAANVAYAQCLDLLQQQHGHFAPAQRPDAFHVVTAAAHHNMAIEWVPFCVLLPVKRS